MTLSNLIYVGYCLVLMLTCAVIGCFLVRKNWAPWYKLLVALSCVTCVVETMSTYCYFKRIPYVHLYSVFIFLEAMALLFIFSCEAALPWVKRLCRALLILVPAGAVTLLILASDYYKMNTQADLLYLFAELIAACSIIIGLLQGMPDTPAFAQPVCWLATGILFYACIFTVVFSVGVFLPALSVAIYTPFSYAANTFEYGGFIACFMVLRQRDKRNEK